MKIDRIFFIVNLSAGKEEPILEIIGKVFRDSGKQLTIHVSGKDEDPADIVDEALAEADLIAVYGGDGSITAAAAGLIGKKTPLAIIPGGTANVLSKELQLPQDTETVLTLIRDGKYQFKTIDTGVVNGHPFLLRVNLGIMAEMITETDADLKDHIGQLAYGVTTIKSLRQAQQVDYCLQINGETINIKGVSLTITNSGSMGIGNLQLRQGISVDDGKLDVLVLRDAEIFSIVKAAGESLFGWETDVVSHWHCQDVIVTLPDEQLYLCDDSQLRAKELKIKVVPASLTVIVP